jgi:ATP synthase F1 delta subunit
MMNETNIDKNVAKKYAQAFMRVYPKSCTFNDLKKISTAQTFLQTHKKTLFFLQLPQFDQERRKSMVADLIDYFSLPHDFSAIILLLIEHNRSFYIPDVLEWIIQLYQEQIGAITFSIASASTVTDEQLSSIKKFLEQLLNKKIIGTPSLDASLIAGLRLQSSDYLWEYSVRKQMRDLQRLNT